MMSRLIRALVLELESFRFQSGVVVDQNAWGLSTGAVTSFGVASFT